MIGSCVMKALKVLGKIAEAAAFVGGIAGVAYLSQKSLKKESELQQRYRAYYALTNQWVTNKNEGKKLEDYFKENNINSIAIYGMGTLCELLYGEIKNSDIKTAYFIDRNAEEIFYGEDGVPVINIDGMSDMEDVDAIIVTPVFDYDSISEDLTDVTDIDIISLEEVVYGV